METIDDDCSSRDISFVKTSEQEAIDAYGISKLPALVFFKQDIPNLYEGNLEYSRDLVFFKQDIPNLYEGYVVYSRDPNTKHYWLNYWCSK